jgi:formylmethanofuran dehydrogenase subunit E
MGKLILFLIIVGAIYFFFIKKPKVENKEEDKDLIMCDKCKTFYPSDEIVKVGDKNICKDCYADS